MYLLRPATICQLCAIAFADPALFLSNTPINDYIFAVSIDQTLYFNVSGIFILLASSDQHSSLLIICFHPASHATATDVSIVFQENPAMLSEDPACQALPPGQRIPCAQTFTSNCSCQVLEHIEHLELFCPGYFSLRSTDQNTARLSTCSIILGPCSEKNS